MIAIIVIESCHLGVPVAVTSQTTYVPNRRALMELQQRLSRDMAGHHNVVCYAIPELRTDSDGEVHFD